MATSAPTARVREQAAGDEEATQQLKLGEFQEVPTLTLSETRLLINAVVYKRGNNARLEDNETVKKTRDYLELFARFKDQANIAASDQVLMQHQELKMFERTQLANLGIGQDKDSPGYDPVSEAKALIPSLEGRMGDEELQQLIEDLETLRSSSGEAQDMH